MKFNIFLLLLTIFATVTLAAPIEPASDATPAVDPGKYLTINNIYHCFGKKNINSFCFILINRRM